MTIVAALIIGAEVAAVVRHLRPRPAHAVGAPDLRTQPAVPATVEQSPIRRPAEMPPERPSDHDASAVESADAGTESAVAVRQRRLGKQRLQMIRDADEEVFDALGLPDAARAAIRAINDRYAETAAVGEMPVAGAQVPAATDPNAEQTRRVAIERLLGDDRSNAFAVTEREAMRRVRVRLRPQWLRGR